MGSFEYWADELNTIMAASVWASSGLSGVGLITLAASSSLERARMISSNGIFGALSATL